MTVNLLVVALNFLHLGSCRCSPAAGGSGRALAPAQLLWVDELMRLVGSWDRPPLVIGGRGRARVGALDEFARSHTGLLEGELVTIPDDFGARPFSAERCRFMKHHAAFDPLPWLAPLEAAVYDDPTLLEGGDVDYQGVGVMRQQGTRPSSSPSPARSTPGAS